MKFYFLILISILTYSFSGCLSDYTQGPIINKLLLEIPNLSANLKAMVYCHFGSATSPDSYQVTIKSINDTLRLFEIDNPFFTFSEGRGIDTLDSVPIHIYWLRYDSLKIEYNSNMITYIQEPSAQGIKILYDTNTINKVNNSIHY